MQDPDDLDVLFAQARDRRPEVSQALMARVLADAMAEQPKAVAPVLRVSAKRGWLAEVAGWLGGAGALAGVGGAAAAGLFIGFVQPAPVTEFADAVLGVEVAAIDLLPSSDSWLAEE